MDFCFRLSKHSKIFLNYNSKQIGLFLSKSSVSPFLRSIFTFAVFHKKGIFCSLKPFLKSLILMENICSSIAMTTFFVMLSIPGAWLLCLCDWIPDLLVLKASLVKFSSFLKEIMSLFFHILLKQVQNLSFLTLAWGWLQLKKFWFFLI